jgi:hypothetical protein
MQTEKWLLEAYYNEVALRGLALKRHTAERKAPPFQ